VTWFDRFGQRVRMDKARPFIERGARVLDIGCGDGTLFRYLDDRIATGVGIDPDAPTTSGPRFSFVRGVYPDDLPVQSSPFDAVVGLAVLEHLTPSQQAAMASACFGHLRPHGRVILTVPSPAVDPILHVIQWVGLGDRDTMHLHEHHGFNVSETRHIFEHAGFTLVTRRRFELRLNNLFVFSRPADQQTQDAR
jgi:cyclopropane fatty-acyl-phospholipid synthase-like methyltransferase